MGTKTNPQFLVDIIWQSSSN